MRVSLHQMTSGPDPVANAAIVAAEIGHGALNGAELICFPEAVNLLRANPAEYRDAAPTEAACPVLAVARRLAAEHNCRVHLGSLLIARADGKVVNRTYLIGQQGQIVAQYDKVHLFDVDLGPGASSRESANITAGNTAVVADTALGKLGLTVCFDLRFSHLWLALAEAGAQFILAPAAFSPVTGPVHWLPLLQARAIETGCYVIAPAQCGTHQDQLRTHGHSAVISPWGEIVQMAGAGPARFCVDLDLDEVAKARTRIPTLALRRPLGLSIAAEASA
jgi:predicted amidohydrolase